MGEPLLRSLSSVQQQGDLRMDIKGSVGSQLVSVFGLSTVYEMATSFISPG